MTMNDAEFDRAAIKAVFDQAALRGWQDVSLVEAGQEAGLDLVRLRRRFPSRGAVLMRFGAEADGAALSGVPSGSPRERLFDIVMNRFEALQAHRDGVLALLSVLRTDPATSMLLYGATLRSMKWLLEGAGVPASGISGALRVHGLLALWLYALRAWEQDDSPDLSGTMAAVDRGLDRALQAERSLPGRMPDSAPSEPMPTDSMTDPSLPTEPAPLIGDFPDDGPVVA
jgi:ubiquinone biosynthesis protein COQ9